MKKEVLSLSIEELAVGEKYILRRSKYLDAHSKLESNKNHIWILNEAIANFDEELVKFFAFEKSRYSAKQNGQFWYNEDEMIKLSIGKDISPRNYFEFEVIELSTCKDWPVEDESCGRYRRPELDRPLLIGVNFGRLCGVYPVVKGHVRHIVNGRIRKEFVGYVPTKMVWSKVDVGNGDLFTSSQLAGVKNNIKQSVASGQFDKTLKWFEQGKFFRWADVIDDLWPTGVMFNGYKLDASNQKNISKAFETKETMGGRGELLTQALFPQVLAIGGTGDVRGIDLITFDRDGNELIDNRLEVKEPNFRVGVKSFESCNIFSKECDIAFNELIDMLKKTKSSKLETYTNGYYLRHLREWLLRIAIADGKVDFAVEDVEWLVKHIKGNSDYFDADVQWLYDVLVEEECTNEVVEYLLSDYDEWISYLQENLTMVNSGECTRNRALLLENVFSSIEIEGKTEHRYLNNKEIIEEEFFKAVDPITCFGDVNIMFVNADGYILYSPSELSQVVKDGKYGTITQGKASFDLECLLK